MKYLSTLALALAMLLGVMGSASAEEWPYAVKTHATGKSFDELAKSTQEAVRANSMFVVTKASASAGAKARDVKIPGNLVLGVYRNDFAVRMLEASIPSGIEAPIRLYITENADGTATLTYREPSDVFQPYGSADLDAMARELDVIFANIALDAAK